MAWSRVSKAADISRAVRIVILPESIFSKISFVSLSRAVLIVEFVVSRLKWTETGRNRYVGERRARASCSKILPNVLRLEMDLKWEGSDSDKPGYFKRDEMSASLKFVGKVAWENDRFARWEMRREKISAHDFRREVGI